MGGHKALAITGLLLLLLAALVSAKLNEFFLDQPSDGSTVSHSHVYLNWTANAEDLTRMTLTVNGTEYDINFTINETSGAVISGGNCTGTEPVMRCFYNITGLGQMEGIAWNVSTNDTSGTDNVSESFSFDHDTGGIQISEAPNWTWSNSNLSFSLTIADFSPETCTALLYEYNGSSYNADDSFTGTFGDVSGGGSGGSATCTGTIDTALIDHDGPFIIEYTVIDGAGNENATNRSGVMTNLYDGWSLIAYPHSDTVNASTLCSRMANCDQVAYRNNTAGAFKTYSTSTPSVNADTPIGAGEAVLIHTDGDDYHAAPDYMPVAGDTAVNVTLFNDTWNVMGLVQSSNMSAVYNAVKYGTSEKNITFASWINQSTFVTCRRSVDLCTGTSADPTDVPLLKGYGVWALLEDMSATSIDINRSTITGG